MKISAKLIAGFFVLSLLLGFVGYFGITSVNSIQENNHITTEIIELTDLLDSSLIQVLRLVETETLDDHNNIKSKIEDIRIEFDILHEKKHVKNIEDLMDKVGFHDNIDEFTKISNGILATHKEKLIQNKEFSEKYALEKDLRYKTRESLTVLRDVELREDLALMEYYSKEAIFQYKDQEHVDKWLESIEKLKDRVEKFDLPQENKSRLLQDIGSYGFIAPSIGRIVIDQRDIESKELLEIGRLQELIDRLEKQEEEMINTLSSESQSVLKNTYSTLLIAIITAVLTSIILGLYIASSISRPIQKLTESAKRIKQGDLDEKCESVSKDEIGELAKSFDEMRLGLKDRNDLLNSLLNTFKGKFGNLATIIVRGNIQELVDKNPRIKNILPKSIGVSIKKAKKLGTREVERQKK
ncbi:MAG: HAMP domain-containing protein [Candidatus Woesearchaeota archaeon]